MISFNFTEYKLQVVDILSLQRQVRVGRTVSIEKVALLETTFRKAFLSTSSNNDLLNFRIAGRKCAYTDEMLPPLELPTLLRRSIIITVRFVL